MKIPFLVIIAWFVNKPLSLDFHIFETVVCFCTVIIVNFVIRALILVPYLRLGESRPTGVFIPVETLGQNGTAGDNGTADGSLQQAVLGFLGG